MGILTPRRLLRRWRSEDREAFAALNADPRVAEHLPSTLSRSESDAFAARIDQHFDQYGFGLFAVEIPSVVPFIGYVGLSVCNFPAHFTPAVEIGWRLAYEHWGHGYATEGGRAVLAAAFGQLQLPEVVSFTVPTNARSRRVMDKLGLQHTLSDDFEHPMLPLGHPLRPHVLYRLSSADWWHAGEP